MNILSELQINSIRTFSFVNQEKQYGKDDVLFSLQNVLDVISNGKITTQIRDVFTGRNSAAAYKYKYQQQIQNLGHQLDKIEKKDLFLLVQKLTLITYQQLLQVLCICQSQRMIDYFSTSTTIQNVYQKPQFDEITLIDFKEARQKYCLFYKDNQLFFTFQQYYEQVCVDYEGFTCIQQLDNDQLNEKIKEIRKKKLEQGIKYVKKFICLKKKTQRKKNVVIKTIEVPQQQLTDEQELLAIIG